jgi:hypothetical protein
LTFFIEQFFFIVARFSFCFSKKYNYYNSLLLTKSKGLFHRVIIESGPFAHWGSHNLTFANSFFTEAAQICDCDKSSDIVACLQAAPTTCLLKLHPTGPYEYFLGIVWEMILLLLLLLWAEHNRMICLYRMGTGNRWSRVERESSSVGG